MITYQDVDSGLSVKIPYEIKDSFKQHFPSAKWDATHKRWQLGKRSKKRLLSWVQTVEESGVLEALKEREEYTLTEREIDTLLRELESCKQRIKLSIKERETYRAHGERLKNLRHELEDSQNDLEQVAAEVEVARLDRKQEKERVTAMLQHILSFNDIKKAKSDMERFGKRVGREAKEKYLSAQGMIMEETRKLAQAGFTSKGLMELSYMNFNRPDRDDPSLISLDDILTITKNE